MYSVSASKEVDLKGSAQKMMLASRHRNVGPNYDIKVTYKACGKNEKVLLFGKDSN
jgi:hypothetical protein